MTIFFVILKTVFFAALMLAGVAVIYRVRIYWAGLKVTSWFRSPAYNRRVGGVPTSLHLIGWSFDVVPANPVNATKLRDMGFRRVLNEGDHLHAQIV